MKRIGIIGGMSFESTCHYYKQINRLIEERLGGFASADMVLRSVNFEEYHKLMESGEWDEIARRLSAEALSLICNNQCDYIAIATNTMHKVADKISGELHPMPGIIWPSVADYVEVPLIHIGDCIADECITNKYSRVAIIGTRFTMTDSFMKDHLRQRGLEVFDKFKKTEITEIDRIIFEELCHGKAKWESAERILNILYEAKGRDKNDSSGNGFSTVVLGCTELGMLSTELGGTKLFNFIDSTEAHVRKIVELSLS